ncbi:ferredoxin [Streptomyces sp. NPDC021096]|uniref:ferredoxin n=1 Tax=Streptomyces sp. NPDC021096 TaxID=3154792 RepID=UPI0033FAA5FB
MCAAAAPGAFRLDTARRARPVAEETEACPEVLEAAENCPTEAVSIHLAKTGEAVFPPEE